MSTIIPFAQGEMVHTFMEGVDPDYMSLCEGYVDGLLRFYNKELLRIVPKSLGSKKREKLAEVAERLAKTFQERTREYRDQQHVQPIIAAVTALPKSELAAMAESLVNLTSFKRRISMETETVGGPIDVAVISKGDGFVWIKRKHYFEPRLNPGFIRKSCRYNGSVAPNQQTED